MSSMYFKCPICGDVQKIYPNMNRGFRAECMCDAKTGQFYYGGIFILMEDLSTLSGMLDKMNIEWGRDEFVWEDKCSFLKISNIYVANKFIQYKIFKPIGDEFWDVKNGFEYLGSFRILENAKQACEEDFQLRRTMYDTGKSLQTLEKNFKDVGDLSRKVGEMLKDALKNRGASDE